MQDVSGKQKAFLARYAGAIAAFRDAASTLSALHAEWVAVGYAPTAPPNQGTSFALTDDVVQQQFPALTAAMVADADGAVVTCLSTVSAQDGYLQVMRP